MSENLTCPFCGTTPEILHDTFAFCDHVGCHIEHHVVPIESWNRRAAPAIPASVVEWIKQTHMIEKMANDEHNTDEVLIQQMLRTKLVRTLELMGCDLRKLEKQQ